MGPAFWLLVAGLKMGAGGVGSLGGFVCATCLVTARVSSDVELTSRVLGTAAIEEC